MPEIPDNWPNWLTLILATIYILRGALIKFLPNALQEYLKSASARRTGHEEHDQELEEIRLNSRVQREVGEQLRETRQDEQITNMMVGQQDFIQNVMILEVKAVAQAVKDSEGKLNTTVHQVHEELRRTRRAVYRSANLTATLVTCLTDKNPARMIELADEIGDIIEGLNGIDEISDRQ